MDKKPSKNKKWSNENWKFDAVKKWEETVLLVQKARRKFSATLWGKIVIRIMWQIFSVLVRKILEEI